MKIDQNKIVALSYSLESNGKVIETVTAEKPMEFMYGIGYLLPKFEENIKNKSIGDTFDFVLKAVEAYGELDPEAIVDLPKALFEIDGEFDEDMIQVGNQVPMQDSDGNRLQGVVQSVDDTTVVMDFNHPLAGAELHFRGTVVLVREATPEDLAGGSGCGCSGGGCGSGSCGDGGCGDGGCGSGGCCGDEGDDCGSGGCGSGSCGCGH